MINLRNYIRSIIKEGMYKPSSVSGKFAIWTNWLDNENFSQTELDFIMYDWSHAQANIDEMIEHAGSSFVSEIDGSDVLNAITEINENGYSAIAAVMRVKVPDRGFGECNGAWEVVRSAAEGGYGPTLYDIIMSISPNGLTSDRNQVSDEAKNIWDFYAHKRPEIEKRFLDPMELTTTEQDDCRTHSPRAHSLYNLTRILAVNFAKEKYPTAYKIWEEKSSMDDIMNSGGVNGNTWIDLFQTQLFKLNSREPEILDLLDAEGEIMEDLHWQWDEYKSENEMDLMNYKEGDFKTGDEFLDLSYNTNYAKDDFYTMQNNHYDFLEYIREEAAILGEYVGYDAVDQFEEDPGDVHFAVRDYFNSRYH